MTYLNTVANGRWKALLTLAVALGLPAAAFAAEPVQLKVGQEKGADVIHLENYRVALTITPARGGAVTAYSDKLAPAGLVQPQMYQGLCMDHFQEQTWPGELLESPYGYKIVKQTPEEVRVAVTHVATGVYYTKEVNPHLVGLQIEKTYTLRQDSPALIVSVRLTAPEDASKTFSYWMQHVLFAGGTYEQAADRVFRPTVRGVRNTGELNNGSYGVEEWIKDFTAGWAALLDAREGTGLATFTDYNELRTLYASGGNHTTEFMFNPVYVPKGQNRTYALTLVPLTGMKRVTHVGEHLLAAMTVAPGAAGAGKLDFQVARSQDAPQDARFTVSLHGVTDKQEVPVGDVSFPALTDQAQLATLAYAKAPADPLVVRVAVTGHDASGREFSEKFEDFFPGTYSWGDNITMDMRTPVYVATRAPQTLTLAKPAQLAIRRSYWGNYLFLYGAFDERYQTAAALHTLARESTADVLYYSFSGVWEGALSDFPYDYEKLLSYDAILFGGVSKSGLRPIGLEMLSDYLQAGGGMVMLGSYGGYGVSHLQATKLAEALPVEWAADQPRALEQIGGKPITVGPDEAPWRDGFAFSKQARCYFLHNVKVKPGAQVYMQCDDRPFLVGWEYGPNHARVICLLGAPLGDPGKGELPFWEETRWHDLLRNALWWAAKQDGHFPPAP